MKKFLIVIFSLGIIFSIIYAVLIFNFISTLVSI